MDTEEMLENAKLLKDILVNGDHVTDWTQEPLTDSEWGDLLLYKPRENANGGFDAVVLKWCFSDDNGEHYAIAIDMTAYHDGVRHIEFYPLDNGYENYPPILLYPKIFTRVRELEEKYCYEPSLDTKDTK